MAQESRAEAAALVRPLDDARNVGHHERLVVARLDDAQVGFERRESIVGDLGLGGRDDRQQRRLPGVGKTDQAHVGQDLKFENESPLVALLAGLRITRRLVGGALEMPVAQASAAALEQHQLLAVLGHLAHRFEHGGTVLLLHEPLGDRTEGYGDDDIGRILARRTGAGTALPVLGELVALVLEVDERPILPVALQYDAAALAAVAAVGTAERHELLAAEMGRTGASVARTGEYLHVIYEVGTCHDFGKFRLQR